MQGSIGRQVKILSFGFLLIFFGFGAIQYYQTVYFSSFGAVDAGFWSLILIYLFFTLFTPLAAVLVSKYGAKKCLILSSLFYSLFIFVLLSKMLLPVYAGSILLGCAAALLWISQNSYLIRASDKEHYGSNSGFFTAITYLGGALGVIILGFLVSRFSFNLPFFFYGFFPLLGFLLFFFLKDLRTDAQGNHFQLVRRAFTSISVLKLASIGFINSFVVGLTLGILPIEIEGTLGLFYIGILSSLIYVFPIIFSYFFGKLSDVHGRGRIIIFSYFLFILGLVLLLFSKQPLFLVLGIAAITLNFALVRPIVYALAGDVTSTRNLEFVTALFWMVQNLGILSALVLAQFLKAETGMIYSISILLTIVSFLVVLPLLKMKTEQLREKVSQETLV